MAIALSGLLNKAPARARKEGRGVVLTLQLTRNGEMTLAVYHCSMMQKIEIDNSRIMVRNSKMTVALHRCNLMKRISRGNFRNMAAQVKLLGM